MSSTSTTRPCVTVPSGRASPTRWPTSWPSRGCWTTSGSASSRAGGPVRCPRTPSSSSGPRTELELRTAELVAFGATRRAGVAVQDDAQVQALLDSQAPVVTLVAKSDVRHVSEALRTTLEENLDMVRDTVAFLVGEGRRVFVDFEHFFDGYRTTRLRRPADGGRDRGRGQRQRPVRHQRRDAARSPARDRLRRQGPKSGVRVGIHCQDDTGCAVANSIAAVEAGATHVQGTANGYGERTGNADLFVVVPNLELKLGMQVLPPGRLRRPSGSPTPSPRSPTCHRTPTSRTRASPRSRTRPGCTPAP